MKLASIMGQDHVHPYIQSTMIFTTMSCTTKPPSFGYWKQLLNYVLIFINLWQLPLQDFDNLTLNKVHILFACEHAL